MPKSAAHLPFRRRFEHACRNSLLRVLQSLLKPRHKPDASRQPISKILIVRTSHNLGDVVMATAMVDECRALFPNATVALLANARLASLFRHHDAIDRLFEFHPRWFLHPLATLQTIRAIRRARFDLAIDCANIGVPSLNNWLLTRLSNATHRVGFQEKGSDAFLTTTVATKFDRHFISVQFHLLTPFASPSAFRLPRIVLTPEEKSAAETLLSQSARPRALVFVPEPRVKCWRLPTFLKMADALIAEQVSVALAFGPGDPQRESEVVRQFAAERQNSVTILPPLGLRQFAAALSQCDLFFSNDCGPMHLAVAVGTPTVSVFLFANDFAHGYHDGGRHFAVRAETEEQQLTRALECARLLLRTVSNRR